MAERMSNREMIRSILGLATFAGDDSRVNALFARRVARARRRSLETAGGVTYP